MFSKIPQKFTAPFGLLGDEAKLAFPSHANGITKLATVRVCVDNYCYVSNLTLLIEHTGSRRLLGTSNLIHILHGEHYLYLDQYFILFDSASEVFSLIPPHHSAFDVHIHLFPLTPPLCCLVRRALNDAPENVATLIQVLCNRLFNLISDHTFPSTTNASVTAYATSFIKSASASSEKNPTKEVLNCLRVLERVLPVVFEVAGESNAFELEVLWKKVAVKEDEESSGEPQFVIEDEDDSDQEGDKSVEAPTSPAPKAKMKMLPSLGERLFNAITDLLYCCGFTLPKNIQVDYHKINYVIWCVPILFHIRFMPVIPYLGRRELVLPRLWATVLHLTATKLKSCGCFLYYCRAKFTFPLPRSSSSPRYTPYISCRRCLDATCSRYSVRYSIPQ